MKGIKNVILFIVFIWLIFFINVFLSLDLYRFGIIPRQINGLYGIIASPLLHANLYHLIANTVPLFILMITLVIFYKRIAGEVIVMIIFIGNALVWLFARPSVHIGASGLIYGIAGFLFFIGLFHKSFKSLIIAIIIAFFYGGLIWGVMPFNPYISWEGHLFGAVAGLILAYGYRNTSKI